MSLPQFRFSTGRILWVALWAAVSCAAWFIDLRGVPALNGLVLWTGLRAVAPCIAIGALFGQQSKRAYLGIISWGVCLGLLFAAI